MFLFILILSVFASAEAPKSCLDSIQSFYEIRTDLSGKMNEATFEKEKDYLDTSQGNPFLMNREIKNEVEKDSKYQASRFRYWLIQHNIWSKNNKIKVFDDGHQRLMTYEDSNSGFIFTDYSPYGVHGKVKVKNDYGIYDNKRKITPFPFAKKDCSPPKFLENECSLTPSYLDTILIYQREFEDKSYVKSLTRLTKRCSEIAKASVSFYPLLVPPYAGYNLLDDAKTKISKGGTIIAGCRCPNIEFESFAMNGLTDCDGLDSNFTKQFKGRIENELLTQQANKEYLVNVISRSYGYNQFCANLAKAALKTESKIQGVLPPPTTPAN